MQYYRDDYIDSYYDKQGDDGSLAKYTFNTTITQDIHVQSETYDPRMYAFNCKSSKVMAQLLVRLVNPDPNGVPFRSLGEKYFSDWIGFGHI